MSKWSVLIQTNILVFAIFEAECTIIYMKYFNMLIWLISAIVWATGCDDYPAEPSSSPDEITTPGEVVAPSDTVVTSSDTVVALPAPEFTSNTVLVGHIKSFVPVGAFEDASLKVSYVNGYDREGVSCSVTSTCGISGELKDLHLASGEQESTFEVPLQGTAQENGDKTFTVSITYDQNANPVIDTVKVLIQVDELDIAKGRGRILGALFSDGTLKNGVWAYATPSQAIMKADIKAATDFLGVENFESFYNENTEKYRINLSNTPWDHTWESEEPDDFAKYLPEFIVAVLEGEGNKTDGMIIDDPNETHAMTMVNMCNYQDVESYLWKNNQTPPNYFKGYAYEKDWPKLQAFPFAGYGRCPGGKPEVVEYAPTALIISLTEGQTVSGQTNINVLARDKKNIEADKVILYVDDVEQGSDPATPFSIPFDTQTVTNGTVTIRVKAVAANGYYSYSPPVKVTISN